MGICILTARGDGSDVAKRFQRPLHVRTFEAAQGGGRLGRMVTTIITAWSRIT